jgi:phospholipase/carboxylesterase
LVSLPGARAFFLDRDLACGPEAAFQAGTEFAHIHAPFDGSLHVTLPEEVAREAIARGWGEPHLVQKGLLIFGPRDEQE